MQVRKTSNRVTQGDVYKDVDFIEYVVEEEGNIEVAKIVFPLIIVLTQDCDLEQDSEIRYSKTETKTQDKLILSVLVAPLYNAEQVYLGNHLDKLSLKMQTINKNRTPGDNLRNNETPRYHYLVFPGNVPIVPSVIDFKHYFSVNIQYLRKKRRDFICSVSPLYREDISHRFAGFLSRIGLPEDKRSNIQPIT